MSHTERGRARALASALAVLAATAALASGCTSDDDEPDRPASPEAGASVAPEVPTKVTIGTVAGRLPKKARHHLGDQIGKVVDGWFDAAYLGGDYPRGRSGFADAWPGFTAGAAADARRDGDLMSNRDIGSKVDAVEAKRKVVRLDVLAPRRKPAGVTAHVRLRFATTGDLTRTMSVVGRLYLTRTGKGWKVFGYDMTKDGA